MVELTAKERRVPAEKPATRHRPSLVFEGHTELQTHHRIRPRHVLFFFLEPVDEHHVICPVNVANGALIAS